MACVVLILLWFGVVFDPVGSFYSLNKILLLPVFFIIFKDALTSRMVFTVEAYNFILIFLCFSFFFIFYGLLLSQIRGGQRDEFIDTSYISSFLYLCVVFAYLNPRNYQRSIFGMAFALYVLSFFVIISYFVYWNNLGLDFLYFFVDKGILYLGDREYGGFVFPYVYYISAPVISILACKAANDYLNSGGFFNLLKFLIPVVALCLTGVRTAQICGLIIILTVLFFKARTVFLIVISLVMLIVGSEIITIVSSMFALSDYSNSTKLDYLPSYVEMFTDYITLLLGQGFNAHAWNATFSELITTDGASKIELTYLELLRVFGLFFGIIFILVGLIIPLVYLKKNSPENRWLFYGVVLFLFSSSMNPYLFSGAGMLAFGLVLGGCINTKSNSRSMNIK